MSETHAISPQGAPPSRAPLGPDSPHLSADGLAAGLRDLLCAELSRQRNGIPLPLPLGPVTDLPLGPGGLGADSLERTWLALAVHEFLTLDHTAWDQRVLGATTVGALTALGLDRLAAGPCPAITFRTSGTSGSGRPVRHPLPHLWDEVESLARLLDGRRRIVRLVPAHHIYGFMFTVLLPARLGIAAMDDQVAGLPARLRPGDLVIGHPLVWIQAARYWSPVPEDVWITTSTGPCPAEALARLRNLGVTRAVEIYGATESRGVGWRDDPDAPFALLPHLTRDAQGRPTDHGAPLPLQDHLTWEAADRFRVGARLDGGVSVGGHTVRAAALADQLRAVPGVLEAMAWPIKTPGGARLAARVTVADATAGAAVRQRLATLPAPDRPIDLTVTPERPTS